MDTKIISTEKSHLDHMAPIRFLARHLHKSKPLEELVTKQRYRRKRVAKVEVVS